MQSISAFLDIPKFADFQWKNAAVSRTQGVWHVIHMFFLSSLSKIYIIAGYVWQILWTAGGKKAPLFAPFCPSPPPRLWAAPKMPILNRVKISRDLKVINTTHVALGEKDNSREVFVPKIKLNTEILRLFNYDNNSRCAISPLIKTRISSTLPFLSQINENEQPCL